MLEVDMFRLRRKHRRGFFVANCHYRSETEARCITPRPVGLLRRMSNAPLPRYLLIIASVLLRYNITLKLNYWYNRLAADGDVEDSFKITGT